MLSATQSALWLLPTGLVIWVVKRAADYRERRRHIGDWPGYRGLGPGGNVWWILVPDMVKRGFEENYLVERKHKDFAKYGWDVITNVSWYFPVARFHIAEVSIIQSICNSRTQYPKPYWEYEFLDIYGPNVVTSEGNIWAKHRKISSPAFNETMIQLAWEQTIRIVHDMFDSDWDTQGEQVAIDNVTVPMKELALLVLMGAAFGQKEDWTPQTSLPPGHLMTFREALQTFLKKFLLLAILPKWIFGSQDDWTNHRVAGVGGKGWLGKVVQTVAISHSELGRYLREMVDERQRVGDGNLSRDKRDVFTSLVAAMGDDGGEGGLSADEVFGSDFAT